MQSFAGLPSLNDQSGCDPPLGSRDRHREVSVPRQRIWNDSSSVSECRGISRTDSHLVSLWTFSNTFVSLSLATISCRSAARLCSFPHPLDLAFCAAAAFLSNAVRETWLESRRRLPPPIWSRRESRRWPWLSGGVMRARAASTK
eukprot:1778006-Prymnesium_polylepis.1